MQCMSFLVNQKWYIFYNNLVQTNERPKKTNYCGSMAWLLWIMKNVKWQTFREQLRKRCF